ncbi:CysZ protein [Tepidamorphus gemmatus]|jgi:CysZ protein|uniref:CysZ protein n=1 Tax=Tepidamorphus gemmatus TaxID=747076 RepID=A0A4R3MEU4_9HYPH|nr:sulfate transporter family protein [Tepidamorphus gemmatus]TCT12026.1 CysZ protein [Tepidamorphus gemmatus]
MIADALAALSDVVSAPFRRVLLRSLGLTIAVLVGLWLLLVSVIGSYLVLPWGWLETLVDWLAGAGLLVGMVFLVAPVTSLVAGLHLDEIAETVETTAFPGDRPGVALPIGQSVVLSLKFSGLVILANLIALVLLLVPGVNLVAFYLANAYLLGREYFELAALRYRSYEDARNLRRANGGRVFLAGLLVALMVSIPIVNLLTPLFATSLMVRLHRRIGRAADLPQTVLSG